MSRILRALGLGGGGSPRSDSRFDSPKVRRIRETMRWRGYDLSEYSDEQIVRATAQLRDGISELGETTEAGRRALADVLAQGDFSGPAEPVLEEPAEAEEEAAVPPSTAHEPRRSGGGPPEPTPVEQEAEIAQTRAEPAPAGRVPQEEREAAGASRAELGMPQLLERLKHLLGIHSWHEYEEGNGAGVRCIGCGQSRGGTIATSPTPDPPDTRPSPPEPVTPLELPNREKPPRERASGSPWQFFLGLPWWSKLLAAFILLQVIGFVASLIGNAT